MNADITFKQSHVALLLKYSGISFISGAVNHGFFSGQRSIITAAIGVVLFVLGAWMEHRLSDSKADETLLKTLFIGTLLSIGLGFFTGGLQHFPDSPARSSWVVPLGFVLSVIALAANMGLKTSKSLGLYAVLSSTMVALASWGAWQYYAQQPADAAHTGHAGHSDHHTPKATPVVAGNASTQAYRAANDAMHKGMDIAFTGDADADFLAGMVPHHQGAIDMARVVLAHGKDPKIRELAQQIIAAQEKEIAQMNAWAASLGKGAQVIAPGPVKHAHGEHKH